MKALKYTRDQIKQIAEESFFNGKVSSFWRDYAIVTNQKVGEWDGRDSFVLELHLDHSDQKEFQKFSLSNSIKKSLNSRFEKLFDLLDEELLEIKKTDKNYLRINKINSILEETEKAIAGSNIAEKYRNQVLEIFSKNRESFQDRYRNILNRSIEIEGSSNSFIYENMNKNYDNFKSFFHALKANRLINNNLKIGQMVALFQGESVNKIEWLGEAKETNCFFKALKKSKKVRVKGGIWKAVESKFIIRNTKGEEISSKQMRSLDVFDEKKTIDRERKKEILSIVDML